MAPLVSLLAVAASAVPVTPAPPCSELPAAVGLDTRQRVETHGTVPVPIVLALPAGGEWLIEVREDRNDAMVQVLDAAGSVIGQADHPERRTGTRRLIVSSDRGERGYGQPITLLIVGKEHEAVIGSAAIVVFDLGAAGQSACGRALRALAAGDAEYAIGQQISRGRATRAGREITLASAARDAYARAAGEYLAAAMALEGDDAAAYLRGEAALALAGVRYYDLQEWRGGAEWAEKAADSFVQRDAYRHARAQALAAAAWIEMANGEAGSKGLFGKARRTLRELYSFHLRRGERYDAALQINNVAVADFYEGRFRQCVAAAGTATALFATLSEAPRHGLAWQNQALCFWGLGHLPEALAAFDRALTNLGPEPYPNLYVLTLNDTGLMNFALGHFDEALRLLDRALGFAVHLQNRRGEALSLYGIGVTYYGLGDLRKAREFLERALAIRTAVFDGQGRRETLRSLATVYADLGEYARAVAFDREALVLATKPTSRALGRIQLAAHTALSGGVVEGIRLLDELLAPGVVQDPLVRAQARLARAVIERGRGDATAALRDLDAAIPAFRRSSSVTDGFSADLERARDLKLLGHSSAALESVESALKRSESIRTQTANPEFRARLQLPLRAAYDLKLDLLWDRFEAARKAGDERQAASIAAAAFHSADGARARSFADIAAERYTPTLRHDLAGELARRAMLDQRLAGLRFARDSRVDSLGSADPRAKLLDGEIAGVERELDTLNTAIATRAAAAGEGALIPGGAMLPVPDDAALIAFWLGAQHAYGWTDTSQGVHWVRLEDPATITAAARDFHDALSRLTDVPREGRLAASQTLFGEIIRPVEPWAAPYRRWFVIPDGALNYVPVGALRAAAARESPYVAMTHDVALAPAAWMLLAPHPLPGAARDSRMLLVSDPVYERTDPRLAGAHEAVAAGEQEGLTYQRLPGTAREARAVRSVLQGVEVDELSGFDASRERLLQLDWSRYRLIHIASHGQVDAQAPPLSSLVLSTYDRKGQRIEGALRDADLSSLTLSAKMAVFSGCDTALGMDVSNEGMVGIAYSTLARGAQAVVSSLWEVPDEIGANLMTELYAHLIRDAMSPMTALSASQRSILVRNPDADPALWAAFQVSVLSP